VIVPVIRGATGTVTKGFKKNLEAIVQKHSVQSVQKTDVRGPSHTVRCVLQCDTGSVRCGDVGTVTHSAVRTAV
jgi:hypothetical protein